MTSGARSHEELKETRGSSNSDLQFPILRNRLDIRTFRVRGGQVIGLSPDAQSADTTLASILVLLIVRFAMSSMSATGMVRSQRCSQMRKARWYNGSASAYCPDDRGSPARSADSHLRMVRSQRLFPDAQARWYNGSPRHTCPGLCRGSPGLFSG